MSVLTQMVCDFIFTGIAKTEFNSSIAMIVVKGLSLIIFPDAHIRKQVYNNSTFQNWLKGRENPLPLLTVDECISF